MPDDKDNSSKASSETISAFTQLLHSGEAMQECAALIGKVLDLDGAAIVAVKHGAVTAGCVAREGAPEETILVLDQFEAILKAWSKDSMNVPTKDGNETT